MTTPQALKTSISHGLLSFPLTDFDSQLRFAPKPFANRLAWLMPCGATAPVSRSAGPVRPPLPDLLPAELDQLGLLIAKQGSQ